MSAAKPHDLVVIGGGVGGLVTASVAGQLGLDVVMVEREPSLGGDCLHYGCVPSKTLIRSAEIAHLARRAGDFGVNATLGSVDLGAVRKRVREVIATIQKHDDPDRFRGYGIDVVFGEARFLDPHSIQVDDRVIAGRRFVIATGSRPAIPPIEGLEGSGYWTNETIFDQTDLPEHLAVLGAGPIGLELAQAFHRLGSRVTVLEATPRILAREDPEITDELARMLRGEGLDLRVDTRATRVEGDRQSGYRIHLSGPDGEGILEADALLVATGRRANTESLDLPAAGVELENGLIRVDRRMRTAERHIFACGDCTGPYPFTHAAEYQAGVVIANTVFRLPKKVDYRVMPWVTYTAPELAHVGLTEAQAREQGVRVKVARFRFSDVDRALAEGSTGGLMKLLIRRGRIAGATILGPHAGELLHEVVLAMKANIRVSHLAGAVHAYPTLAQIHRRVVNSTYADTLYSPRTRGLVRWINRILP